MRRRGVSRLWMDDHGANEETIELLPEKVKEQEMNRNQDLVFGTQR